jgi:hypothetical protein
MMARRRLPGAVTEGSWEEEGNGTALCTHHTQVGVWGRSYTAAHPAEGTR